MLQNRRKFEKNSLIKRKYRANNFGNCFFTLLVPQNLMIGPIILNTCVIRLKYCEKCLKTAENAKNRRIQLKYRAYCFGNTFIRFLDLENIYFGTKTFVLR